MKQPPESTDVNPWTVSEGPLITVDYFYICAEVVVGILTILINVVILLVIVRYQRLHTHTNVYIRNLTAANIFVGLMIPPLAIITYLRLEMNLTSCLVVNSLINVFINISIMSLILLAVDTYFAVQHPFLYRRTLSKRRFLPVIIAVGWFVGACGGLVIPFAFQRDHANYRFCSYRRAIRLSYDVYIHGYGFILPALMAMLVLHLRICCAFRAANQRLVDNTAHHPVATKNQVVTRVRRKEVHMVKSLAVMFLVMALCFLPLLIINFVHYYDPDRHAKTTSEMTLVAVVLSHMNSFVNPLLYAVSKAPIRSAVGVWIYSCFFTERWVTTSASVCPIQNTRNEETSMELTETA
ncbi:adenosine receptor A3-like [Littorina saxatilis]|uniref:adenosine receptor A3-like n=1 Tax=Littorina saxatilis TaxID=31220 RepID=UPI0038B472B0